MYIFWEIHDQRLSDLDLGPLDFWFSLYVCVCISYAFLFYTSMFWLLSIFFPHLSKVEQEVGQQKVEKNISPALVILIADKRPTTKESY